MNKIQIKCHCPYEDYEIECEDDRSSWSQGDWLWWLDDQKDFDQIYEVIYNDHQVLKQAEDAS